MAVYLFRVNTIQLYSGCLRYTYTALRNRSNMNYHLLQTNDEEIKTSAQKMLINVKSGNFYLSGWWPIAEWTVYKTNILKTNENESKKRFLNGTTRSFIYIRRIHTSIHTGFPVEDVAFVVVVVVKSKFHSIHMTFHLSSNPFTISHKPPHSTRAYAQLTLFITLVSQPYMRQMMIVVNSTFTFFMNNNQKSQLLFSDHPSNRFFFESEAHKLLIKNKKRKWKQKQFSFTFTRGIILSDVPIKSFSWNWSGAKRRVQRHTDRDENEGWEREKLNEKSI